MWRGDAWLSPLTRRGFTCILHLIPLVGRARKLWGVEGDRSLPLYPRSPSTPCHNFALTSVSSVDGVCAVSCMATVGPEPQRGEATPCPGGRSHRPLPVPPVLPPHPKTPLRLGALPSAEAGGVSSRCRCRSSSRAPSRSAGHRGGRPRALPNLGGRARLRVGCRRCRQ